MHSLLQYSSRESVQRPEDILHSANVKREGRREEEEEGRKEEGKKKRRKKEK